MNPFAPTIAASLFTMLLPVTSLASAWAWQAGAAIESSATPHAIIDLAIKRNDTSIALQTDTLDIRYGPTESWGRWWTGARLAAFGAELFFSPWLGGAPLPEAALRASYAGLDSGAVLHLPRGWYIGARVSARVYDFGELDSTAVSVPEKTHRITPDLILGHWSDTVKFKLTSGFEWIGEDVTHALTGRLAIEPSWSIRPLVLVHAGHLNDSTPALARKRIGGLNPYVVPFSGAAWAEWWARRYAVIRGGMAWAPEPFVIQVAYDLGVIDDSDLKHGGCARIVYQSADMEISLAAGYGFGIVRQPGVSAMSLWAGYSRSWQSF